MLDRWLLSTIDTPEVHPLKQVCVARASGSVFSPSLYVLPDEVWQYISQLYGQLMCRMYCRTDVICKARSGHGLPLIVDISFNIPRNFERHSIFCRADYRAAFYCHQYEKRHSHRGEYFALVPSERRAIPKAVVRHINRYLIWYTLHGLFE